MNCLSCWTLISTAHKQVVKKWLILKVNFELLLRKGWSRDNYWKYLFLQIGGKTYVCSALVTCAMWSISSVIISLWQVLFTKSLIKLIFWNWNIKFHVGKSILTCRVKMGIEAKKEPFKCKLIYHGKYGNLCWCRNLDFHEILALSVSFSSAEEKE